MPRPERNSERPTKLRVGRNVLRITLGGSCVGLRGSARSPARKSSEERREKCSVLRCCGVCVCMCVCACFCFVWLAGLVVVLVFFGGEVGCVLLRAVFGLMWCCVIVGCVFFFGWGVVVF